MKEKFTTSCPACGSILQKGKKGKDTIKVRLVCDSCNTPFWLSFDPPKLKKKLDSWKDGEEPKANFPFCIIKI